MGKEGGGCKRKSAFRPPYSTILPSTFGASLSRRAREGDASWPHCLQVGRQGAGIADLSPDARQIAGAIDRVGC